jgi:hypothetical protein
MKKIFSRKDSSFMLFLLIVILLLTIRSGKYTYIVNSLFFIAMFLTYRVRFSVHTFCYFLLFGFLTIWGFFFGNDFTSIAEDILSFSPLILLFIEKKNFVELDLKKRLPIYLVNSLYFMIPVGIILFILMDYQVGGLETKRFDYDESTNLALFGPILPFIFAPTLVFFFDIFNKKQKLLVFTSMFLILIMGVITLTKSVIVFPIIPILLFYGYKETVIKNRSLLRTIFFIVFIGFLLKSIGFFDKISTINAVADTIERAVSKNEKNDFTTGRYDETMDYLNQDLSVHEYLFGRGMGGRKVRNESDGYIGGINMMHFGPSHVFLKGGIFLVFLFYLPLFLAVYRFWNTPNYPISLILICFFLWNIQTTTWSWGIGLFFYWYAISFYYTSKHKSKSIIKNVI